MSSPRKTSLPEEERQQAKKAKTVEAQPAAASASWSGFFATQPEGFSLDWDGLIDELRKQFAGDHDDDIVRKINHAINENVISSQEAAYVIYSLVFCKKRPHIELVRAAVTFMLREYQESVQRVENKEKQSNTSNQELDILYKEVDINDLRHMRLIRLFPSIEENFFKSKIQMIEPEYLEKVKQEKIIAEYEVFHRLLGFLQALKPAPKK
jgi:hypothetical protein